MFIAAKLLSSHRSKHLGYMSPELARILFLDRLDQNQLLPFDVGKKQNPGIFASQGCTCAVYAQNAYPHPWSTKVIFPSLLAKFLHIPFHTAFAGLTFQA